jgi:hypothetical protein
MMTRGRLASSALASALLVAAPAFAQPKRDPVAADYVFREARKAARAGNYAKACPLFAESLRLDPGAGTLMNLADCEEHVGQIASAWEHWREALDDMRGKNDKRQALARRHIEALEKRLPRLTLRLEAGAPDGAHVERDGVDLGASVLGLPVPVNPGSHVVVVHAPSHQDRSYNVSIEEAQLVELGLSAGPATAEKTPTTSGTTEEATKPVAPEKTRDNGTVRTVGYGLVAFGIVGLAIGGVTGLIALDKKNTVSQHCDADPAGGVACRDQTGVDAADTGRTMSTLSTLAFASGAALAAVGAALLIAGGGSSPSTTAAARATPGGAFFALTRTF